MHPVLGGLADEVGLLPSGGAVALDGVSLGADEVVELGQLDDEGVVVVLEEGLGLEAGGEDRTEDPSRLFLHRSASCTVSKNRTKDGSNARRAS